MMTFGSIMHNLIVEDEGGNVQKDGLEDLIDSEEAIDELDKANITSQSKNKQKGPQADMFCSDSDHETFILECVAADKEEHLVTEKGTESKDFCPSALMESTPSKPFVKIVEETNCCGGKLESMEYCASILKSVDFPSLRKRIPKMMNLKLFLLKLYMPFRTSL